MKLSINKNIINKNENKAHQSQGFEALDITINELCNHINSGYAFSYQFEKNYRKAENFICSDIIAADFDDGMTLAEALRNDFFINNAALLYTTVNHTSENNRFRVVFQLPYTVTDKSIIHSAQTGLTRKFPADVASVDPARQFYGSTNAQVHVFGKSLSEIHFDELIKLGQEKLKLSDNVNKNNIVAGSRSHINLQEIVEVKNAQGEMARLLSLAPSTPIYCPYHYDKNPSAFTTISRQGIIGIHCSKCEQTFWPKEDKLENYDFFQFDHIVKLKHNQFTPSIVEEESGLIGFDDTNPYLILDQKYLTELQFNKGTTLIKSPKGTGKTHYLKQLVKDLKDKNLTILLVGHRRSLINDLSLKLGLVSYLDNDHSLKQKLTSAEKRYFAVSVDSISTCLNPLSDKFDVIIIDESEQVFSHLISDLIPLQKRNASYTILKHYLHVAKHCVAMDADLNEVTLSAIKGFGNKNPFLNTTFILNKYKNETYDDIEIFDSANHLLGQMFIDIDNGQRLYVCSNSKNKIASIVEAIHGKYGKEFPLLWITSDNSKDPKNIHFIENIQSEFTNYKIVLTSPVLGTGIDITFPDNEKLVDSVYGFFEARINTHHDIDQQISRVRQPGAIKVWISPEKFNFETELDPIRQELAESGLIPHVRKGFAWTGVPEYDLDDPYLNLYTTILSAQRASKNRLKQNFIELRRYNGWNIVERFTDKKLSSAGADYAKVGKELSEQARIEGILNAPSISVDEADVLMKKSVQTQPEQYSLERYFLHCFYGVNITEELIILDKNGLYRKQIETLAELYLLKDPILRRIASKKTLLLKDMFTLASLLNADGDFDPNVKVNAESLSKFGKFCVKNSTRINRELKIDIRLDVENSPTKQLSTFLNLIGLSLIKAGQYERNRKRIYEYTIDPMKLEQASQIIKTRQANNK